MAAPKEKTVYWIHVTGGVETMLLGPFKDDAAAETFRDQRDPTRTDSPEPIIGAYEIGGGKMATYEIFDDPETDTWIAVWGHPDGTIEIS